MIYKLAFAVALFVVGGTVFAVANSQGLGSLGSGIATQGAAWTKLLAVPRLHPAVNRELQQLRNRTAATQDQDAALTNPAVKMATAAPTDLVAKRVLFNRR